MKIKEEESFRQWLLMSGMAEVSNYLQTKTFQFTLRTRRSLMSNAIGNGLEANGHWLRMEKIKKATSRMV